MNAIPLKYLQKMGRYSNMNVHGETVSVIADAADSSIVTDNYVSEFCSHLEHNNVKVVGVDAKQKVLYSSSDKGGSASKKLYVLALYASDRCLIFHLESSRDFPASLQTLIKDPNICFVGPTELLQHLCGHFKYTLLSPIASYYEWKSVMVSAGELAARVLKKPELTTSGLANVAKQVGVVKYDGPSNGTGTRIQVDSKNLMVLSEEMVKTTINDVVAHYLIASKLFTTLDEMK